ncbi:hypothetical protein ACI8AK_05130 [Geodermatophilus sp. SYSU D00867]
MAIVASILALAATAAILGQAVRVLVHPGWTLGKLAHLQALGGWQHHWLKEQLGGLRGTLGTGQTTLEPTQLYRHFATLNDALATYRQKGEVEVDADLDKERSPKIRYTDANENELTARVTAAEETAQRIAVAANLLETRRRFAHLRTVILAVGAVPILAIPVFIAATTPPPETPIRAPIAVRVVFFDTPEAKAELSEAKLPPGCAGRQVRAIAVGGTLAEPVVVSDSLTACNINRVKIGVDIGVAYPENPR